MPTVGMPMKTRMIYGKRVRTREGREAEAHRKRGADDPWVAPRERMLSQNGRSEDAVGLNGRGQAPPSGEPLIGFQARRAIIARFVP